VDQPDEDGYLDERAHDPGEGLAGGDTEGRDGHGDGSSKLLPAAVNASVVVRS